MVSFGISITPNKPIDEWVRLAKIAEDFGIENIWVADESPSPSFRDVFVTLTSIATHTQRVRLGTSICNPYSRHPALIAVAILTLDEISNGRTIVGLGPGGSLPLDPLGIPKWRKPVETVRTTVELLRKLFAGEKVDHKDEILKFAGVELFSKPKRKIPIYLAARGPKMLELVGEIADGSLLTALPLGVVDQAIERIRAGARSVGRSTGEVDIAYLLRFSISHDGREARELVKPNVAYNIADSPSYTLEKAGIKEDEQQRIRETLRNKGLAAAADLITKEMIDAFAVAGTPEECVEKCLQFMKYGITQLVFGSPYGPKPQESLKMVCEEIIPRVLASKH